MVSKQEIEQLTGADVVRPQATRQVTQTQYGAARIVLAMIEFVSWAMFVVGVAMVGIGVVQQGMSIGSLGVLFAALPGLAVTGGGLLLLAYGQMLRATLDTSDCTREILLHMKSQERGLS